VFISPPNLAAHDQNQLWLFAFEVVLAVCSTGFGDLQGFVKKSDVIPN